MNFQAYPHRSNSVAKFGLTQILTDEAICELLLAQALEYPERADVLERYLERAEPRCRFLHDQIINTGDRLLAKLTATEDARAQEAG